LGRAEQHIPNDSTVLSSAYSQGTGNCFSHPVVLWERKEKHPMQRLRSVSFQALRVLFVLTAGVLLASGTVRADHDQHHTTAFSGVKVNGGTATHSAAGGRQILTLSPDFKVPDSPAPHWQVVDSRGNVYLLQRLVIKGDKFNKQITVPAYVRDIAKVQIWCAWAEVLLGEASFSSPVR
jgi:hypothetical protein